MFFVLFLKRDANCALVLQNVLEILGLNSQLQVQDLISGSNFAFYILYPPLNLRTTCQINYFKQPHFEYSQILTLESKYTCKADIIY